MALNFKEALQNRRTYYTISNKSLISDKEIEDIVKFAVTHAWNGEEAVRLFRENLPDLVLMDIKMPILNGYESFQKIRELSGNVPVIAVTAYASEEDQSIIRKKGFNDFIAKPIYASLLKDKIAALLKVD